MANAVPMEIDSRAHGNDKEEEKKFDHDPSALSPMLGSRYYAQNEKHPAHEFPKSAAGWVFTEAIQAV